jgi:hypothetical protein
LRICFLIFFICTLNSCEKLFLFGFCTSNFSIISCISLCEIHTNFVKITRVSFLMFLSIKSHKLRVNLVFFFLYTMITIFFGLQALSHLGSDDSLKTKIKGFFIFSGHIPSRTCGIFSMLPTSEERRDPGSVFFPLYSRPRVLIGVDVFRPQIYCIP